MSESGDSRVLATKVSLVPLLAIEDLERVLQVHRRTIARLCERGVLPQPIKLGGSNRWRAHEIEEALRLLAPSKRVCRQEAAMASV